MSQALIPASPAGSLLTLSGDPAGNLHQLLELGAAVPSAIPTEMPSSENSETVTILLAILASITRNTTSGDVLCLSIMAAKDACNKMGISSKAVDAVVRRFTLYSAAVRSRNPLAF